MRKRASAKKAAQFASKRPLLREWIAQFPLFFTDIGVNFSYDIETNGEAWLIKRLGSTQKKNILDIGANVGDWTIRAAVAFPQSRIFCFEPNPPIYNQLVQRVAGLPSVTTIPMAIAPNTGSATLNIRSGETHSGVSSLTKYDHHDTQTTVKTICGDEWLTSTDIQHIDFMKLDVEGYELTVLKSFSSAFAQGRISVMQIEFANPNPYERIFLRDIYDFAEAHKLKVGRLYPNFVMFKDYEIRDEWWHGPNYVLCRADEPETIARLENKANQGFHMRYLSLN